MAFASVSITDVDLQDRAKSRLLRQFRQKGHSPVIQAVLSALVAEIKVFSDVASAVMRDRMPLVAEQKNLDVIGRIVGQIRVILNYAEIGYFTSDADGGLQVDDGLAWVPGAPNFAQTGNLEAQDPQYRDMIEAKVYRNFMKTGSVPEIQGILKKAFGIDVGFEVIGPMEVNLHLPAGVPTYIKYYLSTYINSAKMDYRIMPPYPMTLRINSIVED